uniref:Transmembrane protein n=1 Tax=Podarcis muralis TaxID=64176 RepID=A0A670ISF0_PODMU
MPDFSSIVEDENTQLGCGCSGCCTMSLGTTLVLWLRMGWTMPSIFLGVCCLLVLRRGSPCFLGADTVIGETRQALGLQSMLRVNSLFLLWLIWIL